jgi:secreted trypsin-like serine protease
MQLIKVTQLFAITIVLAWGVVQGKESTQVVSPQVVGGDDVSPGKYPFIVAFQKPDIASVGNPYGHWCGGSLIDATHVLTAAHCFATRKPNGELVVENPEDFTAIAGVTTYGSNQGQQRNIKKIVINPGYDTSEATSSYDVAVLTLDAPTVNLTYIKLGDINHDKLGKLAIVAGWGDTVEDDPTTPITMQEGKVKITGDNKCVKQQSKHGNTISTSIQVCASSKPVDTCQGDSGGPMFRMIEGSATEIGIVSFGVGCASNVPGVYTRISNPEISQFINDNL